MTENVTHSQSPKTLVTFGSGADYWTSNIRARCHDVDVISIPRWGNQKTSLQNVSGLIGWRFPQQIFSQLPRLRWIQFISVGVDEWADSPCISPGVVVTNTKGLYGDSVADYVMWSLLTLMRKFDAVIVNQRKRRWRQVSGPGLHAKVIGILGMGTIGLEVAKRAKAFDMRTIGIVRETDSAVPRTAVDEIVSVGNLRDIVGKVDALVVCVPLTNATRGLLNSTLISKLRPDSYLVVVSRAEVVDELAVLNALKNGELAGAAFDTFNREPLSRWSPLWKTVNLIVTPHVAALTDDYRQRVADLICDNVNRFCVGKPLLNVVDPDVGY